MPQPVRKSHQVCNEAKYRCLWCGETKTSTEMKGRAGVRGKPPATCADCRDANPELRWCAFHGRPCAAARFYGRRNACGDAVHEQRYPNELLVTCPTCGVAKRKGQFKGRGFKMLTCMACVEQHPDLKWCRLCGEWRSVALFPAEPPLAGARCSFCVAAANHGLTVTQILKIQGATSPECAVCGSTERLCVDHDHTCCGSSGRWSHSCGKCVRGYLCYRCNTAEGSLRTSERAFALAKYLLRHEQAVAVRG